MRKRIAMWAVVGSLLPMAARVVGGPSAEAPVPGAASAAPLKVMTFNIRYGTAGDGVNAWPERRHAVIEAIRRQDPDLLGVQEALAFQVDYLVSDLPQLGWFGVGRRDGKRKGEFSAVFYRRSRFEPVEHGTWWLSETPEVPGSVSWDSALSRTATWAVLRETRTGRKIVFVTTHFDHRGEKARRRSARLLKLPSR